MEPLPCPFCGKPVRAYEEPSKDGTIIWTIISHGPSINCGVSFIGDQLAVASWNNYQNMQPGLSFEQCIREEFLTNTENFPKEYHRLFSEKFKRAEKRYAEQNANK